MTTQTEALKLALEAYLCREMPSGTIIGDPKWWVPKIANAIKEALAQPEQQPVAHSVVKPLRHDEYQRRVSVKWVNQPVAGPLYTTPPQRTWVGLTDDDKMAFLAQDFGGNRLDAMDWAEKRLKEKNT